MAKIALDPGHGGSKNIPNDSTWNNAVGPNGTLEKKLNLDIALHVTQALNNAGHEVRMTRIADLNLRHVDRARMARDFKAQAFVSIHFNGSERHDTQGTETLVHTKFSQDSARLSLAVHDAVLRVTKLADRNAAFDPSTRIRPQSLEVLRPDFHGASTAACLIEVSYLDRADEEARLGDAAYRENIAKAIAAGIGAYFGKAETASSERVATRETSETSETSETTITASGTPNVATMPDFGTMPAPFPDALPPDAADGTSFPEPPNLFPGRSPKTKNRPPR